MYTTLTALASLRVNHVLVEAQHSSGMYTGQGAWVVTLSSERRSINSATDCCDALLPMAYVAAVTSSTELSSPACLCL